MIVIVPPELMVMATDCPVEVVPPNCKVVVRGRATLSAGCPTVATLIEHGLTVTVAPFASGWPAGKLELETTKIHEPKFVVPVAVAPPEAILKAGVVPVLVKAKVVAAVVPNSGTAPKVKGVLATALAIVAFVATVTSAEATVTGVGSVPPQAASMTTEVARMASLVF